jgi:DNA repair exonuclease SbcCD ATPase subunit
MSHRLPRTLAQPKRTEDHLVSRRAVMGASGLAVLVLLSRRGAGAEEATKASPGRPQGLDRLEQSKSFFERLRNSNPEQRSQIMAEQRAQQRQQSIEDLKGQLSISETDWPVVKPRIEKVYDLVHPAQPFSPGSGAPKTEVQQRSDELRELLRDEKAATEQIKSRLSAYRAAKEKTNRELAAARQNLRQVVTLRQEVQLVLNGLLD